MVLAQAVIPASSKTIGYMHSCFMVPFPVVVRCVRVFQQVHALYTTVVPVQLPGAPAKSSSRHSLVTLRLAVKSRLTLGSVIHKAELATLSDVPWFEYWRAHHPYRNHGVMVLGSRDHSRLVCGVSEYLQPVF